MAEVTWSVSVVPFSSNTFTQEIGYDPIAEPERYGRDYADWTARVMRGFEARAEEIRTGAVKTVKDTLGATEVGEEPTPEEEWSRDNEEPPPWERKVEKSEPWKSGGPVKKPKKIDWN